MRNFFSSVLLSIITLISLCIFFSCNSQKKEKPDETVQQLLPDQPAEVTVVPLQMVDFDHELVSNGKISARTVAELRFQTSEVISQIYVRNGSRVSRGQRIASLNTSSLSNKVTQAKDALDRATLDYQDVLIGQGYKLDEINNAPADIAELAKIKSGLNAARTQLQIATQDLQRATLTAPISGTIANLFAKTNTLSNPSQVFCNIIDTRSLEVQFTVLENELGFIKTGDDVKITPFSIPDLTVRGKVTEINPWVDENGMVQVKASVVYNSRLVEGMNVRVSTFRSAGKQWVVPKTAVVLRTGKQVVFTVVDGKAIWNYVQTGLENATEYTITSETLKDGDLIITSGNINLAHESPVKVVGEEKTEN
jgi:RND family efflux transporter MFP subunit